MTNKNFFFDERWLKSFFICLALHILSWPIIVIISFGSAMSAFSPGFVPPEQSYWKAPPLNLFQIIWSSGYLISSKSGDHIIFGSALPPAPENPDFSDPQYSAKLKLLGERYYPEYARRQPFYVLCWIFNEVFFAAIAASILSLLKRKAKPVSQSKPIIESSDYDY